MVASSTAANTDAAKFHRVANDGDIPGVEDLLGHGRGGHPGHRLPGRRPPAAPVVPDAVLGVIGEVPMPRAKNFFEMVVVAAAGVAVQNDQADGGAGGASFEDPGEDFHPVLFPAPGGVGLDAGAAPGQKSVDVGGSQGQAGRAAVDDRAQGRAVGLTPGSHPENPAKGVACHDAPVEVAVSCKL